MRIRRLLAVIHRWLGLATGLIVFVVAITGAVYVWEQELFAAGHPDLVRVAAVGERLSADSLLQIAQGAVPSARPIIRLTFFPDPGRSAVAMAQQLRDDAPTYFHEFLWYDEVYLNPYTGQVLGVLDRKFEWLFLTRMIHTNLLLATRGTWIVGMATLIFALLCIVGLVLWWPRTRAVLQSRLVPRLRGPWKRSVFDAHNIIGVWLLPGLLLLALTGPVWTWGWYGNVIAWGFTGRAEIVGEPVPVPGIDVAPAGHPVEAALLSARRMAPDARRWAVELPETSQRPVTVGAVFDRSSLWEEYERYYYHPANGTLLGDERFEEKNLALKWRNSNYGIHTGTLFGWPTQVLATMLCLVAASLPVTGVFIWAPRWRRQRERERGR